MILELISASLLAVSDTGRFIAPDSARLYFDECGRSNAGPALVLLHDGLLHSVTWDEVWPLLCQRFHVLRYDRHGMGRSEAPRKPIIATEDLTALLADRGIATATLVGSSSGAGIAIDYAFRHPDMVDRLVLIGPVVHGMSSSAYFLNRGTKNNAPLAGGNTTEAARNWANDKYQIADGHDQARRALFNALASNPRNLLYKGDLELQFAVPAATRISEVGAPTLILVGESDIADVHAYAGAVELGDWGALREVVSNAGHLVQLEQPAFLSGRIADFIAQTPVVVVNPSTLASYVGTYDGLMYGRPGKFVVSNGRLMISVPTQRDLPMFPSSDSTFYALAWGGLRVVFRRDSAARVTAVSVADGSGTHRALRTSG